ncbi:multicopper oxidase [Hydnomerulius pinastri MD-312]|nr:multicopper oxidase [Hydnomerulius pinastri MD-312]
MYFLIFFALSILSTSYAASIVSRSQSQPLLPRSNSLGPVTNLTISNKNIAPDGFMRSTSLAGGTFPAPLIRANRGDRFALNVVNELRDQNMFLSTSVHWHGLFQNGTNYADGVSFVTQCPISQNDSFLHQFDVTNQAGTYWYHSHYSSQTCDGLRGPLVIYDPKDPYRHMYDVDDESTVITLADWYHVLAPVLNHIIGVNANSTLINGLGRYTGGPKSELAVVNVEQGKRYRLRLVGMSCNPSFLFSIDGHNLTVIEADGLLTEPLLVDSLQIFAGQRYSVILEANKPIANYWLRALPSTVNSTFNGGLNSAILRYKGATDADPTSNQTKSVMPLLETNLHALVNPGAPGIPEYGKADINIHLTANNTGGVYYINGVQYKPPTVPVLLQIMSGAQLATDLMPNGSVITLEPNKVVELTMVTGGFGGPHPIHLHGHAFDVVQSAGNTSFFNYKNPVRRDVVSSGIQGQQMVIRWVTDNAGPWFLHCHIDWHLEAGFAVVFAENPSVLISPSDSWDNLCPIYNSLTQQQLGGVNSYEKAANITTLLLPN